MKKRLFICASAILSALLTLNVMAQDARTFSVSGFSKLSMGSAFRIDVKQGSSFKLSTSGRKEDLDDLEANVSGGVLKLRYKSNGWNKNRKTVNVSVVMPSLDGVDFSGASTANVSRFSGVKNMEIEVSGASKVTMELVATKVEMDLSGASTLNLNGNCDMLDGDVSGASSFKGHDFQTKEVNIDASGASSAAVFASTAVRAEASGASSVRYSGGAKDIHSSSSGASSIKRGE